MAAGNAAVELRAHEGRMYAAHTHIKAVALRRSSSPTRPGRRGT
jgi:hypothetical protein